MTGETMRVMRSVWLVLAVVAAAIGQLFGAVRRIGPKVNALPRLIRFSQHAWVVRGHAKVVAGGRDVSFRGVLGALMRPAAVTVAVIVLLAVAMHFTGADPAFALATVPIATMRTDYSKLMDELEAGQKKMETSGLTQAEGDDLAAKSKEALRLQAEIDAYDKRAALIREGKKVPDPALPEQKNAKKLDEHDPFSASPVAGYMTFGEYVQTDPAFMAAAKSGWQRGTQAIVMGRLSLGMSRKQVVNDRGELLVPLTAEERKQRESTVRELMESKAEPTIGTGVINPQLVSRVAQVTADDRFTLRDLLDVSQTNSDSIKYFREESFTNAAAPTAQGATKPESTVEYTAQTADVEVIAHWMPVHNQQLSDWPALRGLIEGRLRYGLRRVEENQIMYGSGSTPQIQGLLTVSGTTTISGLARYASTDDSLLDAIRMGVTEVRVNGYEPNGLAIHPRDWEEIELLKGTDEHYVWAVIRDVLGPRVWGLRVVESVAMQARAGVATEARNLLVGDFQMGATLYDRMQATVMTGWIDRQFIQNKQTLLAEERIALAIFAPKAFAKLQTVASATS